MGWGSGLTNSVNTEFSCVQVGSNADKVGSIVVIMATDVVVVDSNVIIMVSDVVIWSSDVDIVGSDIVIMVSDVTMGSDVVIISNDVFISGSDIAKIGGEVVIFSGGVLGSLRPLVCRQSVVCGRGGGAALFGSNRNAHTHVVSLSFGWHRFAHCFVLVRSVLEGGFFFSRTLSLPPPPHHYHYHLTYISPTLRCHSISKRTFR